MITLQQNKAKQNCVLLPWVHRMFLNVTAMYNRSCLLTNVLCQHINYDRSKDGILCDKLCNLCHCGSCQRVQHRDGTMQKISLPRLPISKPHLVPDYLLFIWCFIWKGWHIKKQVVMGMHGPLGFHLWSFFSTMKYNYQKNKLLFQINNFISYPRILQCNYEVYPYMPNLWVRGASLIQCIELQHNLMVEVLQNILISSCAFCGAMWTKVVPFTNINLSQHG